MDRKANIFDRVLALLMILVMVFSQGNLAVFAEAIEELQSETNREITSTVDDDPDSDGYLITTDPDSGDSADNICPYFVC